MEKSNDNEEGTKLKHKEIVVDYLACCCYLILVEEWSAVGGIVGSQSFGFADCWPSEQRMIDSSDAYTINRDELKFTRSPVPSMATTTLAPTTLADRILKANIAIRHCHRRWRNDRANTHWWAAQLHLNLAKISPEMSNRRWNLSWCRLSRITFISGVGDNENSCPRLTFLEPQWIFWRETNHYSRWVYRSMLSTDLTAT